MFTWTPAPSAGGRRRPGDTARERPRRRGRDRRGVPVRSIRRRRGSPRCAAG